MMTMQHARIVQFHGAGFLPLTLTLTLTLTVTVTLTLTLTLTLPHLPQLLYRCSHSYCQTRRPLLTLTLALTLALTNPIPI